MGDDARVVLHLYVAGDGPNSSQARRNLRRLLQGIDAELEVIDVFDDPGKAAADGVVVTPTLLRLVPRPLTRIVGNLSDRQVLADALHLRGEESP